MLLAGSELLLVLVCFSVAVWNTSVGPSGAVTFATMATVLPPTVVVPVHAIVETGAGLSRTLLLRQFVDWQAVVPFIAGGVIGITVAASVLDQDILSHQALQILLGLNILLIAWIPLPKISAHLRSIAALNGLGTSFLTLFVGATSPLVTALISKSYQDHRKVLGTSAACMLFQHGMKIPVFGLIGFSFFTFAKLIILLIAATTLGTWIGRQVLVKIPQHIVKPIFKILITVLGINLIRQGLLASS